MSRPRPPSYNFEKFKKQFSDIEVAKNRFDILDEYRKEQKLPNISIALEALSFFQDFRKQGYTNEELKEAWCDSWGKGEVIVPAALLDTLMTAWRQYCNAPSGTTLGEAFGLEAGGQGKLPAQKLQMNRDKTRRIAQLVEIKYTFAGEDGQPISEERAQAMIAEQEGLSFETVSNAYENYPKKELRQKLKVISDGVS
tara:strand:+ start:149 stop:739 length:591 start_codon:yes stop_codon:yes gene_type:complete